MSASVPHYHICLALLWRDGELLIARRPHEAHLGGFWEFPGGKVKPGEEPEEGLLRELREELGVAAVILSALPAFTYAYPDRHLTFHPFNCRLTTGEPAPQGATELRWVQPQELSDFAFPPANATLLAQLQSSPPPVG